MARSAAGSKTSAESPAPIAPRRSRALTLAVAVAFGVGLALWIIPMRAELGGWQNLILTAIVVILCAIRPARDRLLHLLERIRMPNSQTAWRASGVVALLAGLYLFTTAWWQATSLVPKIVDESSYLIQIRMLAHGRLWLPPYPPDVRPFFDSFNILVEPQYGSMYFPGTALLYVPTEWLDLPFWAMPLLVSAACVGLFYRLVVELIDGAWAAVGVITLLGLTKFRGLSVMLFSQTPMLFFGLLMMLAYLRWRKDRGLTWAAVIGGLAGWAGITRPADALCYAVPIGLAMLLDLMASREPAKLAIAKTLLALVVAVAPFLALQVVQNIGMTGNWWEFPEARYADETYPAPMLGFHYYDPSALHRPKLLQKQMLNDELVAPLYEMHRPANIVNVWWELRLPETLMYSLPQALFVVFVPIGLLALRERRQRVLAATLFCFIAFYIFYVFYIPHYMVVIAPAMIVLALLGFRAAGETIGRLWPRVSNAAVLLALLLPAALAMGALPELNRAVHDEDIFGPNFLHGEMPLVEEKLTDLSSQLAPGEQALVLFRFHPDLNLFDEEPVYNTSTGWPDDAKVIRAHDRREEKNKVLFRYYADVRHKPGMQVYLYDRATGLMSRLGTVETLARQAENETRK
jgi:hypothetical protein